jgi:hypothetical protein
MTTMMALLLKLTLVTADGTAAEQPNLQSEAYDDGSEYTDSKPLVAAPVEIVRVLVAAPVEIVRVPMLKAAPVEIVRVPVEHAPAPALVSEATDDGC